MPVGDGPCFPSTRHRQDVVPVDVVWCPSPGKHPRTEHGLTDATTIEEVIRRWWTQWPDANVGVVTGEVSGLVVVDIVSRNGGDESFRQMEVEHGHLPQTLEVRTGGGRHLYFRASQMPLRSRTSLCPGIDVKADGGYVVAPPSAHAAGDSYDWTTGSDSLADMPAWLLANLTQRTEPIVRPVGKNCECFLEGERNDQLTKMGGLLRRQGLSDQAIGEELAGFNSRRCVPPLIDHEVRQITESISRYAPGPPAQGIRPALLRDGDWAERKLPFRTAAEIAESTPENPDWIAEPWVVVGAITTIDGKAKAAGKTTWVMRMVACILDGQPFMGYPTSKSPVVYLTEEDDATFREALDRAGLLGRKDLHILSRQDAWDVPWKQVVESAIQKCREVGARLLVVDTVFPFAGLTGDRENDAGAVQEAVDPLRRAAGQGLAVVASRHERKSGGPLGDSARGSSAFTAAADVVIAIRRPQGHSRPTVRELEALSRFSETPPKLVIELTDSGYVAHGDSRAVAADEARRKILESAPRVEAEALDIESLIERCDVSRATAQRAVDALCQGGELVRVGGGKKGDPFRWWRPNHSAQDPAPKGAEINVQVDESNEPTITDTPRLTSRKLPPVPDVVSSTVLRTADTPRATQ